MRLPELQALTLESITAPHAEGGAGGAGGEGGLGGAQADCPSLEEANGPPPACMLIYEEEPTISRRGYCCYDWGAWGCR
jgi:hypothetical protein